jgi:hypothetical protein
MTCPVGLVRTNGSRTCPGISFTLDFAVISDFALADMPDIEVKFGRVFRKTA